MCGKNSILHKVSQVIAKLNRMKCEMFCKSAGHGPEKRRPSAFSLQADPHVSYSIPRSAQGGNKADSWHSPSDMTTHQLHNHHVQPEKPHFRFLTPHADPSPKPEGRFHHCCSIWQRYPEANRQGIRQRARQKRQTRAQHKGSWASISHPGPGRSHQR